MVTSAGLLDSTPEERRREGDFCSARGPRLETGEVDKAAGGSNASGPLETGEVDTEVGNSFVAERGGEAFLAAGGGEASLAAGGGEAFLAAGGGDAFLAAGGGDAFLAARSGDIGRDEGGGENTTSSLLILFAEPTIVGMSKHLPVNNC